jgi:tetratricopeptide (TPR) repeat protein
MLASTLLKLGDPTKALPHFEHALVLLQGTLGPDHTDLGPVLTGMAACYHYAGQRDKARQFFERALALQEHVFGPDNVNLVPTLNNTAEFLRDLGDGATAMPMIERAQKITEATVGRQHPFWHNVATTHAELLMIEGKLDEARAMFDDVLQVETKTHSAYMPYTLMARARLALAQSKWAEAVSFDERSIAGYEAAAGSEAPDLWRPLTDLAHAKIKLGKSAEARPLLERALAIADKTKVKEADRAPIRAALASLPAN